MNNVLKFYVQMKDMMSGTMMKVARTSKKSFNAIEKNINDVRQKNNLLAYSYDEINKKIKEQEQLVRSSRTVSQIRAARRELQRLKGVESRHVGRPRPTMPLGGGLGIGGFGLIGAAYAGREAYMTALGADSARSAINFATNGRGNEAVSSVKAINEQYGLSNAAGLEGFKTLAGSVRSLNMPLKQTLDLYESVGQASAAMKINGEAQKGIFLALGQIASKGTVSAEELRGQIGERLPGAFGIAAKAMGVTEQELGKMMQRGELASKDFLPKFAAELRKTFEVGAKAQKNSPQAVFARFNNTLREVTVTIGGVLIPVLTDAMQLFIDMAKWTKENWHWLKMILVPLAAFIATYKGIMMLRNAWIALNIAMTANPIGLILAGIVAVGTAIYMAYKHFKPFREAVDGLWLTFKTVFTNIGEFFSFIFQPIFKAIDAFKKGNYSLAGKEVLKLGFNLSLPGLAKAGFDFTKNKIDEKARNHVFAPTASAAVKQNQSLSNLTTDSHNTPTVSDMVSGGSVSSGPRSITINIGKFMDSLNLHTNTVNEGMEEIERKIEEVFLRVVHSGAVAQ